MLLFKNKVQKGICPDGPRHRKQAWCSRAVWIIVAKAHELTMRVLEPTIFETFIGFGYVRTQHTGLMKMVTMPSDYKCTIRDEGIKQFQEDALEAA